MVDYRNRLSRILSMALPTLPSASSKINTIFSFSRQSSWNSSTSKYSLHHRHSLTSHTAASQQEVHLHLHLTRGSLGTYFAHPYTYIYFECQHNKNFTEKCCSELTTTALPEVFSMPLLSLHPGAASRTRTVDLPLTFSQNGMFTAHVHRRFSDLVPAMYIHTYIHSRLRLQSGKNSHTGFCIL